MYSIYSNNAQHPLDNVRWKSPTSPRSATLGRLYESPSRAAITSRYQDSPSRVAITSRHQDSPSRVAIRIRQQDSPSRFAIRIRHHESPSGFAIRNRHHESAQSAQKFPSASLTKGWSEMTFSQLVHLKQFL